MMHRAVALGSASAPRRIWPRAIVDAACQKRPLPMSTTNRPFMQEATDRMQYRQQQQQQQQQRWLRGWNNHAKHHNGQGLGLSFSSTSSPPSLSFSTAVNRSALSSQQQQQQLQRGEEGRKRATQQGAAGDAEYAASSGPREQDRRQGVEAAAAAAAAGAGVEAGGISRAGGAGGARPGLGAEGGVPQGGPSIGSSTSAAAAAAGAVSAEASSSLAHTVVRHPPTPGWEYPAVPDGCEPKFAVIRLGNTQYKVTKDDVIIAEKLAGDIGTTLDITDVLLVGTHEATVVGRPVVPGATVRLYVEEQTKDQKVVVYKKRRRKSSKTTQGHRREVTLLRVTDIIS